VTFTSSGLGIAAASNNLQLYTDINAAKADLEDALDTLRGFSSRLATHLSVAETRHDFTSNAISLLDEGASNLTVADVNEESATLLALQTRKKLASAAFSLLQDSESSILRLF
jgi:flagellin